MNTIPDIRAKEFFEGLFALDFLTEQERETIYDAAELYAKGRINFASQSSAPDVEALAAEIDEIIREELKYLKIGDVPYTSVIHKDKTSLIAGKIAYRYKADLQNKVPVECYQPITIDEVNEMRGKGLTTDFYFNLELNTWLKKILAYVHKSEPKIVGMTHEEAMADDFQVPLSVTLQNSPVKEDWKTKFRKYCREISDKSIVTNDLNYHKDKLINWIETNIIKVNL